MTQSVHIKNKLKTYFSKPHNVILLLNLKRILILYY